MSDPAPVLAPFHHLRPAVAAAACYLLAVMAWAVLGPTLPGGRWLAVHLFTVGVVTNLVAALTQHFARTLLHSGGQDGRPGRLALLNAGALALLVGRVAGRPWLLAVGGSALIAAVAWLYVELRRARKASLTARFAYVVRGYERACGAFFHGALLGILMGTGAVRGDWYGAARLAHLHVNVLGWGGLTLLATVVFFGPTVMRVRMRPGADRSAPTALRLAALGLSVTAVALLAGGWADGPRTALRWIAACGLAVYASATVALCLPVLRAGTRAVAGAHSWLIRGACGWFIAAAWVDVVAVAGGRSWLLDAAGVALLAGVLAQAILAALNYLSPFVLVAGAEPRNAARRALDHASGVRAAAFNLGAASLVAAVLASHVGAGLGPPLLTIGWAATGAVVSAQLALLAWVRARYPQAARGRGRGDDRAPRAIP